MGLLSILCILSNPSTLVMTRRTQPDVDQRLVLERLGWELPEQGPPRITADGELKE